MIKCVGLYASLESYTRQHCLPHFTQCVVCFSHVFDKSLSDRRGRGYDNLESKQLSCLQAVSAAFLPKSDFILGSRLKIRYAFFPVLPLFQPSGEAAFFHDGEDGAVPFPELRGVVGITEQPAVPFPGSAAPAYWRI